MREVLLDQHFLEDEIFLKKIIKVSNILENDEIVEIGCGIGSLTKFLLNSNAKKIIGFEIDKNLFDILENFEKNFDKFLLVRKNFLKEYKNFSIKKIVANIPYAITEPLYKIILEKQIPFCVLLHGKKFYKKIEENSDMLSVFVNSFYRVEKVFEISGNCFVPTTKVMSYVVKLTRKEKFTMEEVFFREVFFRRKRVAYNSILFSLVEVLKVPKKDIIKNLKSLSKNFKKKKLEKISILEFLELIELLKLKFFFSL